MDSFMIKQYPAKEQAELKVKIKVPGSWFPNLSAAEKSQEYWVQAYEHEDAHHFPKKGAREKRTCPAVKFLSNDDVMEDVNTGMFIMPIDEWNRYRHYTYQDDREAEKVYIRAVVIDNADPDAPAATDNVELQRPPIYSEFQYVSSSTHTVKQRGGGTRQAKVEFWKCCNSSGRCKYRQPFKVTDKATGKLMSHLKKCNPAAHFRVKLLGGEQTDASGALVGKVSFKEQLNTHVEFAIMLVREWDNMWKCRSEARKKWAQSLKPGVNCPARPTVLKILNVIHGLMAFKLLSTINALVAELGEGCIGAQDDIWSMKNCRESYGCLRLSMLIKVDEELLDVNPLASFRTFTHASHTGAVIKAWKVKELKEWNLDPVKSISLWTEDGAANNIKSSKLLKAPYIICGNHQFQRANLKALGEGTAQSCNPNLKSFIKRMSKQAGTFHHSGIASKGLHEAQVKRGVKHHAVKNTEVANKTRWTGIYRCALKTRLLEPDIKVSLTGEEDGICMEEAAELAGCEDDAEDDADDDSSEEEEHGEEGESDAEQVAANEATGKNYPLAHLCLGATDWKLAPQLESVMTPAHEVTVLMQKGEGMDPGTTHLLAASCKKLATTPKLDVVSGAEGHETWKEMHENLLDKMFRTYRSLLAADLDARFKLTGHPGIPVLMCWKMNPSINTARDGPLFANKPHVYELMQGEYLAKLKRRNTPSRTATATAPVGTCPPVATMPASRAPIPLGRGGGARCAHPQRAAEPHSELPTSQP